MQYCNAYNASKVICPLRMQCDLYDNVFKLLRQGVTAKMLPNAEHKEVTAAFRVKSKETTCETFKPLV